MNDYTIADYRSDIDIYAHADDCPCEECEEQRNWSPEADGDYTIATDTGTVIAQVRHLDVEG